MNPRHTFPYKLASQRKTAGVVTLTLMLIACGGGGDDAGNSGNPLQQSPPTVAAAEPLNPTPDASPGATADVGTEMDAGAEPDTDTDTAANPDVNPAELTCSSSSSELMEAMLTLINQARASNQQCGDVMMPAVASLTSDDLLINAASIHSNDMAKHNFFSHTGSDGSSVAQRGTNQGYNYRNIGENIASGQRSVEAVHQAWLDSPGHCQNIMSAAYAEVGFACTENNQSDYGRYWTTVFGTRF